MKYQIVNLLLDDKIATWMCDKERRLMDFKEEKY
jgi:hypothetical protein